MTKTQPITITKRIAKHGKQSIIVIPAILSDILQHGMLVRITMNILEGSK